MKGLLFILVSAWLWLPAQAVGSYAYRLRPEQELVPRYTFEETALAPYIFRLGFATSRFNQAVNWQEGQEWEQIDLVFTLYPKEPSEWRVGYDSLLERRFRNLEQRIPAAFKDSSVRWRLVIQTDCHSMEQASALFHGFVCYPRKSAELEEPIRMEAVVEEEWRYPRFDSAALQDNLNSVHQILNWEKNYPDSTAQEILARHPEWQDALVVMDWTASMYKQGAMVLRWQAHQDSGARFKHLVFFNDGDQQQDAEKVVGATGGIYHCPMDSMTAIGPTLAAVTLGGEGGDHRENDLEAVLAGLAACPDCKSILLIADNSGPVRDMALLELIDRPVHVVLCNAYKDKIEPHYLDIASHNGGSLHTRDRDLTQIPARAVNNVLTLGEQQYQLRGGQWRVHKPRN